MMFDEILIVAVFVMLIASTYMGYCVQRSLYHSRKAFEGFAREVSAFRLALIHLDERVERLEADVAGQEPEQTHFPPRPLN
jgi:hypothetical protein